MPVGKLVKHVTAVKHQTLRNDKRVAPYWSITEYGSLDNCEFHPNRPYGLSDHWMCRNIPKRIANVLETAKPDKSGFGIKKGRFVISIKKPLVFDDFGHVASFKDVVDVKPEKR